MLGLFRKELMVVDCVEEDGTLLVTPRGDAGFRQAELLREALAKVAATRPAHVTLDLSEMPFISSVGMGVLIAFKHSLAAHGGRLTLTRVPPQVAQALQAARLLEWLTTGRVGSTMATTGAGAPAVRS